MAGSSISMLGSRMTTIAYPLLVLHLTGSAFAAGWVAFAATAPSLFVYMPAGALVDRWDPRRAMLICELGRGVAIGTVVVALMVSKLDVPLLISVAIVEEILEVFSSLAERRYVWSLKKREDAAASQVSIEARSHAVVLAGRPLGAFLFGITPILPFLADALSFLASVGTLVSIRNASALAGRIKRASSRRVRNDIKDGLSWLFYHRYARAAMILSAGSTLVGQALIMVFLAAAHAQHLPSIQIGTVLAASGMGGVLGTVIASRFTPPAWASLLQVQMVAWSAAIAILAISGGRSTACTALAMGTLGVTGALGNIESGTYLVRHVEESMLAKVTSIGQLWTFGACALGPVLGALLTQRYGIERAVCSLLVVTMFLALFSLVTPSIRNREAATSLVRQAA